MGYLRSCYSTQARFFYDSEIELPIIWYWAASGASRFGGRSSFSPITFSERASWENPGVGESISAARPWRNGSIPMAAPSGVLDGDPRWFEIGQMTTDPGLERTDFGIPANCAGAQPGYYCNQSSGVPTNWVLRDLLGNKIGNANWYVPSQLWPITDNDGNAAGVMECYNFGTSDDPNWDLSIVTNLFTGTPGQFWPERGDYVPPPLLFQSILSDEGPAVGSIDLAP
jgi:hypothetical protein